MKREAHQRKQRERDVPIVMRSAGVSLRHSEALPEDFEPVQIAAMSAALDSIGCMVTGPPGTGKTRFAAVAVRETLLQGQSAKMALAGQLVRRIWGTYRDDAKETEEQVLEALCTVQLLVIDDMGREGRITDAVRRVFHEMLSRRIDNYLPTVITTNLLPDEIAEAYDASIHSRIGSLLPIVLDGPDRRLPQP